MRQSLEEFQIEHRNFVDSLAESEKLIDLVNLPIKYTGLFSTLIIYSKYTHDGKESYHCPRIKVSNNCGMFTRKDCFTLTLEDEPRVIGNCKLKSDHLEDVKDWVKLNRDHLHDVWHNGEDMDPVELIQKFKKL